MFYESIIFASGAIYGWLSICLLAIAENAYPHACHELLHDNPVRIALAFAAWPAFLLLAAWRHHRRHRTTPDFPSLNQPR